MTWTHDVSDAVAIAFAFALGAVIGSFLNVVIHRLPAGLSLVSPGSHCPECDTPIPAWANLPILSWPLLRGRCHACRQPISLRYPLVEVATAFAFVALLLQWGPSLRLLACALAAAALIAVAFIDGEHQIVPDSITLSGIPIGLAFAWLAPPPGFLDALLGVAVAGGGMWALSAAAEWWYGRVALGMGDVKLVALLGAFLGLESALGAVALGSIFGVLQATTWMALRRANRKTHIPFGPALAAAGIAHLHTPDALMAVLAAFLRAVGLA